MEDNLKIVNRKDIIANNSSDQVYICKMETYSSFQIIKSPFGNCQIFSIKFFYKLLIQKNKINVNNQIKEIAEKFGRPICMCDIQNQYIETFKNIINKNAIISITPYNSTNGSNMNICMINTKLL